MKLFKSGEDVLKKAEDALKKPDFNLAREEYEKAHKKFEKEKNTEKLQLTEAFISLLGILDAKDDPELYRNAARSLEKLGSKEIKFGLQPTKASNLMEECLIKADYIEALNYPGESENQKLEKSKKLEEVAKKYSQKGDILVIEEFLFKNKITGQELFNYIAAESLKWKAEAIVWRDPKEAAKAYQNAANYIQSSNKSRAQEFLTRTEQFGKAAKCWFCGREIYGETVHYVKMRAEITDFQKENLPKGKGELPVAEEQEYVYACRACFTAIYNQADEIATEYYNEAVQQINQLRSEVMAEISDLNRRINSLVDAVNRMAQG